MSKKRSSGEGNVQKLKSGTWRGQLMDGYTDDGKKNIVSFSAPTKGEVLDKVREYRTRIDEHIHLSKSLLLEQWADTWYADYRSQVQPSTYSGYKYTLKIIKKRIGVSKLCDLKPIHINGFLDGLVECGYSLSQIRKCRTMLIQIFNSAEDNGLIGYNPAQRAKVIKGTDGKLTASKRKKDAFTNQEIVVLLERLPNNLMGNSIRVMLGTGLRTQELLALTPDDIASDGSAIRVDKAIKMVDGIPTLGPPKSEKSNRDVPVPTKYRPYVLFLRNHGNSERIWRAPGKNSLYSVRSFRNRYHTALNAIPDVRKLTPHCCRHTYVTQLQAMGVPLETIAKLAGHSDVETTGLYLHLSEETLAQAVEVLNINHTHTEKRGGTENEGM